jgi:hypothetical protein
MGIDILKYNTQLEAIELIGQINLCLNLPTPDDETTTWARPIKYCSDSGSTVYGYTVIIKDQCIDCLTDTQKQQIVTLPDDLSVC